ncbi:FAD/NAD(P)-binding domain-containing protein [Leucogyrophana mollusca]|uniref:FAD/NAD(P)-binding domain-containing protein n=1 Tax=Leucogyrophana mollusca TaxID=85980 RepID=A0ACB8BKV3_9AGAM|nr:FAD/NAD(P)-binding domain-containing protein [Leucogyrophana mollusca]
MKGYTPVVYERSQSLTAAGLSFMLQPNGTRVLSLIPGLVERIPGCAPERLIQISYLEGQEEVLSDSDVSPATMKQMYGFAMCGVRRADFHNLLVETAKEHGIEFKWGHQAVGFDQSDDEVRVTFANGESDVASFVVGCDGLHSNTRIALFGHDKADFTGLVQIGGLSPTPATLDKKMVNNYGDGRHMISYSVAGNQTSWAITHREAEAKEDWRSQDAHIQEEIRNSSLGHWSGGAGELVQTGQKIVKYGLYDRPELKTWYKGRIVLLGDAAHPTSPHLGQGANQAFEDVYHLTRLLVKYNPDGSHPSTDVLGQVFAEYESLRLPRTSELVKEARLRGEMRVVQGLDACKARNEILRDAYTSDAMKRVHDAGTLMGSFTESEI